MNNVKITTNKMSNEGLTYYTKRLLAQTNNTKLSSNGGIISGDLFIEGPAYLSTNTFVVKGGDKLSVILDSENCTEYLYTKSECDNKYQPKDNYVTASVYNSNMSSLNNEITELKKQIEKLTALLSVE